MMMKLKVIVSALVLLGMSAVASAQSCPTPFQGTITGAGNPSFAGNTCNNTTTLQKICSNTDTLGGTSLDVIQWTTGATFTNPVTLSLNTAAFIPELATITGTCAANTACLDDETVAAAGTVTNSITVAANTTYFIFVTDTADGNCGAYTLAVAATPVKLQNFSVN
jgi:hypothetical protein